MSKHYRETPRTEKRHLLERAAFATVMDVYENIKSSLGQPGAIDYAKITGGQRAQFSDHGGSNVLIEFAADVENAVKGAITDEETDFWEEEVFDLDLTTIPSEVLRIRERVGRVFIASGIFPPAVYLRNFMCTG